MKIKGLFLCLLLCATNSLAAGSKTANEYYEAGEFGQAMQAYQKLALIGDAHSLYQMGVMHIRGEGRQADYARGIALIKVADENSPGQGYDEVVQKLVAALKQEGVEPDIEPLMDSLRSQYGKQAVLNKFSPIHLADRECKVKSIRSLKREAPRYPRKLQKKAINGVVIAEFNISSEGYVRDIQVDESTAKEFTHATLKALPKWYYPSSHSGGLQQEGNLVRLDFNMADQKVSQKIIHNILDPLVKKAESGDPLAQYQLAKTLSVWKTKLKKMGADFSSYKAANKWHFESAKGGHPFARYELGRNMIRGKGCKVDAEGGLAWLAASAASGYGPAQGELAKQLLKNPDADINEALQLLHDASKGGHYLSSINLAWLLATHSDPEIRNGKGALELLEKDPGVYFDNVRILETKAAAYAAIGDFDEAEDYQDDAIDAAEDYDWEIPVMKQRLASYKAKKMWQGEYYQ